LTRKNASPEYLPSRGGELTLRVVAHPPATRRVFAAERQVDATFRFCRSAFHHRPIRLLDPAGLEQSAKFRERLAVPAENETAGSVAIETVRERGRARQPKSQRTEEVFQALAPFRSLVHRESSRLVDYQHQTVAIEKPLHYLFRSHIEMAITAPA
jgi:hypothetical protein